jgi:serine/threonine protein kinase
MPYVRGESLQKRLDRTGPLDVQEILRIGHQAAAGLAAAHAQGLVHRDIKPANILLEEGVERLQITDFGLARTVDDASETRTGLIAGTPQYMSPEQARGDAMDARSDLFSLGSVFYQMCTGRLPFRAETPYGILRRITDTEPRPIREISPEVPEWLTAIVATLHAKEPAERHSAAELAEWLRDCLAHLQRPTAIPLPGPVQQLAEQQAAKARQSEPVSPSRLRRWLATRDRKLAVWIVAGLAIVVTTTLAVQQFQRSKEASQQSASSGIPIAPAPAWDAAADDIRQMTNDLADHESRATRLWDHEPVHSPGFTQGPADTETDDAHETVSSKAEPSD